MEKQPERTQINDNGLKTLIDRYPLVRSRYVTATIKQLAKTPGAKVYARSQIKRVVNGQVPLNLDNKVIKDAFLTIVKELYPDADIATSPKELVEA